MCKNNSISRDERGELFIENDLEFGVSMSSVTTRRCLVAYIDVLAQGAASLACVINCNHTQLFSPEVHTSLAH